jgi:lysophospholipase L1-like esterase
LPTTLERALGAARWEVLGFGVTGYDTVQEAEWYRRAVRPFHPAVLVLVYCINDVMIASGPFNRWATPEELKQKDAEDALLENVAPVREETVEELSHREEERSTFRLLARARTLVRVRRYDRDPAYMDDYLVMYAQKDRVARMTGALAQLATDIRADGATAHLVISPVLRSWDSYHWQGIHTMVSDAARSAGWIVHDPFGDLRASHDPRDLRTDSLHYSATGTRILAESIRDNLVVP